MQGVGNALVMKRINADAVRDALRGKQRATKQELAETTGLSVMTVGTILSQLTATGEAYEAELLASGGGRPARSFCFNAEYAHSLILYAPHTGQPQHLILVRVVNLLGECVAGEGFCLDEIRLESFEPAVERMRKRYPTIRSIGFGLPGLEYDKKIQLNDHPALVDTAFTAHYQGKYGMPVQLENDANLAVMGYCNAHPLEDTVAYLYFPARYGPGAGLMIGGRLHAGVTRFAGELEALPLGIDWRTLDHGEFDAFCTAISSVVLCLGCILNPARIVLAGEGLTESHLQTIEARCKAALDALFVPRLCLSQNFNADFEAGLRLTALQLLKLDRIQTEPSVYNKE